MIIPLGNHLLVRRPEVIKTTGLIHLPPVAQDDNNTGGPKEVIVLAVGPGRRNRKGVVAPIEAKPGDRCIIHSYTTGPQPLPDGSLIITDDQILAVIPQKP
jgi:co-chaperonin GroES (HSP10)